MIRLAVRHGEAGGNAAALRELLHGAVHQVRRPGLQRGGQGAALPRADAPPLQLRVPG